MNDMNRAPVSSRRPCTSRDQQEVPLGQEAQRTTPTKLDVVPSTAPGRGGSAHIDTCTLSSSNPENIWRSNVLPHMRAHPTPATDLWRHGRQLDYLQPPPRLTPLTESPIIVRGFGPPPIALDPLALIESSERTLRARRLTYAAAAPAGACVCSVRSALPLLPLYTVATAAQRAVPVPIWRRSKPLTRLPATTLGPILSGNSGSAHDVVMALSKSGMPRETTDEWRRAESWAQPQSGESAANAGSTVDHVDHKAAPTQNGCVSSSCSARSATEGSQAMLSDALASLVDHSQMAPAQSETATDPLADAPVRSVNVHESCMENALDVHRSSSSTLTSPGHRSNYNVPHTRDALLWAHEAPEQPDYAYQHQLPAVFAQLVDDLLVAQPRADMDGTDDPLARWIQLWFKNRWKTEQLQRSCSNPTKPLRPLDEAAVGLTAPGAYIQGTSSSDCVEPGEELAVDKALGNATQARDAQHPLAPLPPTTSPAAAAARTTTKPAPESFIPSSTAASPPHHYVPLAVEYSCSDRHSRMTSGASQPASSPHQSPQTQPLPVSPRTLPSVSANGTPLLPPHSAADGGRGALAAVVGPSPPQQQQQKPAKSLSGGPHLPPPSSTRSMSSKQTVVAAAAVASGGESDRGASSARPKLATTVCAVLAHSSSSSAPKEAARPQE
ncbi:hypothetical protein, unknown function [Leishmania tarentolae]|uniref:Uncharacterized protein n=1 Tax=Leishmania tarentolae TaxID=5689 RepID=A0A640KLT8_LEITA|nr:hypothetical protein, unknown function [Leishmania tarentolae]